jgi:phytoene dehydrogenase-like protein/NAD-dependent dihydropyrimidine dehydrogenase PreA subunit
VGIIIEEAKCIGCGLCEISCAYDAIDVHMKAAVDNSKCTDCEICLDYCPTDCISLEKPRSPSGFSSGEATFDVAIIGSGVGGLCTGALLARQGYKTLVLERNPTVGGRYSSLKHKGVTFPTGGSLVGKGGPLEEVFGEVGAEFDLATPTVNPRYWVKGRGWVDPGEGSSQLRRTLTLVSNQEEADRVMGSMREILTSQDFPDGTMVDWIDGLTGNEDVTGIFKAITAAAFGPEDVPAGDFFGLLAATAGRGMGLARRGGLGLMRSLAQVIVESGSEVWKLSNVKNVIMEVGSATGLVVQRRGASWEVHAPVIVSDIWPKQTNRMLGEETLDPKYISYVDEQIRPMGGITVHLMSDRSLVDDFPGVIYAVGARRLCIFFEASRIADWAPPGKYITEMYPKADPDPGVAADLEVHAEEAAADLDDIFPGWREHAEMNVICLQGEYPGNQTWTGMGVSTETPIPNLFMVGDGCESNLGNAGGTAAAESAQRAAALIRERFPVP